MRSPAFIGTGLVAIAMALTACGSSGGGSGASDAMTPHATSTMSSGMKTSSMMTSTSPMAGDDHMAMGHGTFHGLNGKHVQGKVMVEGSTVQLTGFSSDKGPDLHLYLANGTDEAAIATGMELGKVASDKGTQSFDLMDADTAKFTDVVVHCDKAKAVFGAAMLSS